MRLRVLVRGIFIFCLVFLAGSGSQPVRSPDLPVSPPPPRMPVHLESPALASALKRLSIYSIKTRNQGVRLESLDGRVVAASHNPRLMFNPASVIKVATSYLALVRLGPDHRFTTRAAYQGSFEPAERLLQGDLYIISDGDPLFRESDARELAAHLRRCGLERVDGDLVIRGPFRVNGAFSVEYSARRMQDILRSQGIRISGEMRLDGPELTASEVKERSLPHQRMVEHRGPLLKDILWHTNAFSVNVIADRLGDSLGGPAALQGFLRDELQLAKEEVFVTTASGLDANGLSPRATVQLLRGLHHWLDARGLSLPDILPAAGVDRGTLSGRFRGDHRGCVFGKTGTQLSWDEGVSALAGIIYTRSGPYLAAIYNSHGDVRYYRDWQDRLLADMIAELGGGDPPNISPRTDAEIYGSGLLRCFREGVTD